MKLYVIGNGFDMAHGLATSYAEFGRYIKKKHEEIFDHLREYLSITIPTDIPLNKVDTESLFWSNFEQNLASLDRDGLLEYIQGYVSSSYDPAEEYAPLWEAETIVSALTTDLISAFSEFICNVKFPPLESVKLFDLDSSARFLSFNYTDTLNRYYGVPYDNIVFIHGMAEDGPDNIVLGHGIDPEDFRPPETPKEPPEHFTEEQREMWLEDMWDNHNPAWEEVEGKVYEYFRFNFKDTDEIIEEHKDYFDSLANISEVVVIGHSMSDVDWGYFEKLKESVRPDAKWTISYYADNDIEHFESCAAELKLDCDNVALVKTSSLILQKNEEIAAV